MPSLTFAVEKAEPSLFAAVPTIAFSLRIENSGSGEDIQSVALRSQILIEASRRRYNPSEREALSELFGEPERWSRTLRSLLWCHAGVTVPSFRDRVEVALPVPCTFDFNVAAAKYFHGAAGEDDIPLRFQFSGTIFYRAPDSTLQIAQIDWNKEAAFRLPSHVWREMMDHYYPNSTWLRLERDVFDRLYEYKRRNGLATFEQTIDRLLPVRKGVAS